MPIKREVSTVGNVTSLDIICVSFCQETYMCVNSIFCDSFYSTFTCIAKYQFTVPMPVPQPNLVPITVLRKGESFHAILQHLLSPQLSFIHLYILYLSSDGKNSTLMHLFVLVVKSNVNLKLNVSTKLNCMCMCVLIHFSLM